MHWRGRDPYREPGFKTLKEEKQERRRGKKRAARATCRQRRLRLVPSSSSSFFRARRCSHSVAGLALRRLGGTGKRPSERVDAAKVKSGVVWG